MSAPHPNHVERFNLRAVIFQQYAKMAASLARQYREDYQRGDHYEGYATRAVIEQEIAGIFSALARAAMGVDDAPALKLIRAGQIEALEFAARQFAVYAADNEEVNNRYGIKGRERKVADKRTQTWRDAADDCERVAAELRRDADD